MQLQLEYLGTFHVYLTSEIGELNHVVAWWSYDSLDDRQVRRAKMITDPRWQDYLAMVGDLLQLQNHPHAVPRLLFTPALRLTMLIQQAAIVGSGIIGRSWAIVFARAGVPARLYDSMPDNRAKALERIAEALAQSAVLVGDAAAQKAVLDRITVADSLADVAADADFVHECIDEKLDSKKTVFSELDRCVKPTAILATTTSSFPVSTFASDLPGRARCIVVHPATPPHLLPVTEICPAPFTDQAVTDATFAFMEQCGQVPVLIRFEQSSFVLNRMQAALVVEMLRCLNSGIISPRDIDKIISQGFGLRWAFLGPFEGVDLNAVGGIREYLDRFGFIFDDMARQNWRGGAVVTPEAIAMLEVYARAQLPLGAIGERTMWRDRAIASLRELKENSPDPAVRQDGQP